MLPSSVNDLGITTIASILDGMSVKERTEFPNGTVRTRTSLTRAGLSLYMVRNSFLPVGAYVSSVPSTTDCLGCKHTPGEETCDNDYSCQYRGSF